jgi:hypothetical protein
MFFRCAILAASHAAISMFVQAEAHGLEERFWTARRRAEVLPDYFRLADQPGTTPFVDTSAFLGTDLAISGRRRPD